MQLKRILILCSKFPFPLKDGGAIANYQMFSGLRNVADVHLLSFNTYKHYINQKEIPAEKFPTGSYTLVDIDTDVNLIDLSKNFLFSIEPIILKRFKSTTYAKKLIQLLTDEQYDIVQLEGLYLLQYIDVIRKHSRAKIAYRAHNLEHEIWYSLAEKTSNPIKKYYLKNLSKRIFRYELAMLNRYDLLLPISEEDASYYQKIGNQIPFLTIPAGFDFEKIKLNNTESISHQLFFIGSLEWQPNQQGILWFIENCWTQLRTELPEITLHVAGRNAPMWLKEKCEVAGVNWVGEVESASHFMMDKSIMLVPLFSGSGMRIKIIEAFTRSKVVVATSVAAKGTGGKHNKHLLIADSSEEFIQQILRIIMDKELFSRLISNAYQHAKEGFDNKKICDKVMDFYRGSQA